MFCLRRSVGTSGRGRFFWNLEFMSISGRRKSLECTQKKEEKKKKKTKEKKTLNFCFYFSS